MSTTKTITEWFQQYSEDIYHYLCYQFVTTDVEDLVQEVFINAFKHYQSFQNKSSPKTWLFSIARHVAIDELRRRKRQNWKTLIPYYEKQISNRNEIPEAFLQDNETKQALLNAILALNHNYRDVIILRAIKELSVSETAEILNWTEEKVRLSYHRALKAIKEKGGLKNVQ